jgi:hypothetical protein
MADMIDRATVAAKFEAEIKLAKQYMPAAVPILRAVADDVAALPPAPDAAEALVKAADAFSDAYRTWSLIPRRRAGEKDAFAEMHRRKVDLDAALAAIRGGAK